MVETLAIYPSARKVLSVLKDESRSRVAFGHRTMTIKELVELSWCELGDERAALTAAGERLAVETVLREKRLDLEVGLESNPGLIGNLLGAIRQFKSASLEPADLVRICDEAASHGLASPEVERVRWVARIFQSYQELLAARALADGHDRERAVAEALHRAESGGGRPRLLEGVTHLLVAEIYDLSLLQYMIIAALIRLIGDARLTIQAAPHDVNDQTFPGLTWNRFVEDESIADQVLPDFVRRGGRDGRLNFILEHVFTDRRPAPPPPDTTVRIVEAPTRQREFEQVARIIRHLLERPATEKIALDRIAIVARDIALFADELSAVMRRFALPLHLAARPPLVRSPAARFILSLLWLPVGGFRREALLRVLDSGFIRHDARRFRPVLADAGYIDESTAPLSTCVERRCEFLSEELAALEPGAPRRAAVEQSLRRARQSRRAFTDLLDLLGPLADTATVAVHVGRLREVLGRLSFARAAPLERGDDTFRHCAAIYSALDSLARESGLVAPSRTISLDEFADLVELALSEVPRDDYSADPTCAVQALSVADARGLDFDLVFVVGLNDELFPHYHNDDPIIADQLKLKLNRALAAPLRARLGRKAPPILGRILRTRYEYNRLDAFLFFLALSMPARELVLTYSTADAGGAPIARSPFVDQVVALLGGDEATSADGTMVRLAPEELVAPLYDCFVASEFLAHAAESDRLESGLAQSVAAAADLGSISRRIDAERARARYLALPSREERKEVAYDSAKSGLAGPFVGRVATDSRLRRMLLGEPAEPRHWRAAYLDDFSVCGFKFFAARVLRLSEDEELDYEPSAREEGSLAHSLLADLISSKIDFADRAAALRDTERFLDSRYRLEKRKARDAAFFDIKWSNVCRLVREVVLWEVARAQDHAARELTTETEVETVVHDHRTISGGSRIDLLLRGRYDRLEIFRDRDGRIDRIRVIDYKTSRDFARWNKAAKLATDARTGKTTSGQFGVTQFQLPVYLLGVIGARASELSPAATIEAGHVVLKSREKGAIFPVPRAMLDGDGAPVPARIIELVAEALDGRFDVDPYECSLYCPFRAVCRYEKRAERD